jgi:CheY-like chemotaxis protein
MRAWLIDDDHVTNMLNRFCLEEHFPHVKTKLYGKAKLALEDLLLNINYPDFIFLDLNMPEMNGWEFLDALVLPEASAISFPQIYILSSSLDPSDRLRAANTPFVSGFLSKPLEVENLQFLNPEPVSVKKVV